MDGLQTLSSYLFKDYSALKTTADREGLNGQVIGRGEGTFFPADSREPFIIYYPAEWEDDSDLIDLIRGLRREGIGLAIWNGVPHGADTTPERWLKEAKGFAQATLDHILPHHEVEKAVFMGCSVGCAAALETAVECEEKALCLIIESAFVETWPYLKALGAFKKEMQQEDPFNNRAKMRLFKPPVLFIQSQRDPMVPPSALEWLVCESRSKATQFQICPATGRQDIRECAGPLYYDIIHRFINLRLGRRPRTIKSWRDRRK